MAPPHRCRLQRTPGRKPAQCFSTGKLASAGTISVAEAIAAGKASPNSCVAAGAEVAEAIAAILGVTVEAKEPDIARSGCYYGVQDADLKYVYDGLADCRAAALLGGGMKVCTIGCLGLGSCARACPFDAITMGPDNLPAVALTSNMPSSMSRITWKSAARPTTGWSSPWTRRFRSSASR